MSFQSSIGRMDSGFGSDTNISSNNGGFGGGSSFGIITEGDSFSKQKGLPSKKSCSYLIICIGSTDLYHQDALTSFMKMI